MARIRIDQGPKSKASRRSLWLNKQRIRLIRFIRTRFPVLYRILFTRDKKELRPLRRVLSFLFGLLVSILMYYMIIVRFTLDPEIEDFVFICTISLLTIGYTFSIQVRTILWLVIPTFLGRSGRNFFILFTCTLFMAGPVTNILENSYEAGRSLTCTFRYNEKLIRERVKLIFEPVKNIILNYGKSNAKIATQVRELKKTFIPFKKEVLENPDENTILKDIKDTDDIIGGKRQQQ